MLLLQKDHTNLAYLDEGRPTDVAPMVLVHGWGCDHKSFRTQAEYFSRTRRVVSLDLRGHGSSDAPPGDYTMAGYAADVAWVCATLGLKKPLMVGHSMGGNILLELAASQTETPGSIILIDSVLFPSQGLKDASAPFIEALQGPGFAAAYRSGVARLHLPTDEIAAHEEAIGALPRAPQHVLVSSFVDQLMKHDIGAAAAGCKVPVAYIGSQRAMADLTQFQSVTPQLLTARVLGAGHFSPVIVPDQINAMLTRFSVIGDVH